MGSLAGRPRSMRCYGTCSVFVADRLTTKLSGEFHKAGRQRWHDHLTISEFSHEPVLDYARRSEGIDGDYPRSDWSRPSCSNRSRHVSGVKSDTHREGQRSIAFTRSHESQRLSLRQSACADERHAWRTQLQAQLPSLWRRTAEGGISRH